MLEGLPPNDATHVMRVSAPREKARRIADLISETYDPAEVAVANFEAPDGEWVVEVFAGAAFDPDDLKALVACAAGEALADAVSFSQIAETDWVSVGPFMVHGAHDRARVKGATIGIEIEAALAFGTGHHGTTQGCLAAVADAARRGRPQRILDIGTGTGVLAIAAARALRTRVTASDIDIVAVRTARENACANGAAPFVRFVHAAGADARAVGQDGPYDLILANILLPPLKRLARPLCALLAPGGTVVLSGLLDAQASAALSAYRARGLHLVRRRSIEGWTTLTLAREAGRPLLRR
jgi:ribosomal protein L11 methyltransferase